MKIIISLFFFLFPYFSLSRNGFPIKPDYTRMVDDNGKLIRCFACKLPASKLKLILQCDFCDLSWHLDCLDPPLTTPVPAYKKWMCPCHVDHALVSDILMIIFFFLQCYRLFTTFIILTATDAQVGIREQFNIR